MNPDFSKSRIAVLGAGKMGGILIKALIEKHRLSPERVRATIAHDTRAQELSHKLGVSVTTDNIASIDGADVILVAQSLGGFTAPMIRKRARMIVLPNAMIPRSGESPNEWRGSTGSDSPAARQTSRLDVIRSSTSIGISCTRFPTTRGRS